MNKHKQTLVYLAAASHSGSTMTAMLLSAHPELCSVGELKAIHLGDKDSYLCSCNTKVSECDFWQGVTSKMAARGQDFEISDDGLLANLIAFNLGVEIGQLLALSCILIVMNYWRLQRSFERQGYGANVAIMSGGFLLMFYQLSGLILVK